LRQGYTNHFSHVTYEYQYDGDDQTYDHATHYDYDIHGNVKTLVQDNQKMAQDPLLVDQQFKRMDYNYDLISGNVHRVSYENGKIDQWHHAYEYDADNRITSVYTTTTTPLSNPANGQISSQNEPGLTPFWDKEASYKYYAHGPLARTELGQEKVQGVDNVYTIQGWIKGVNTNILLPKFDPGQDAVSNFYGTDAYGYSLHYFDKDYYSISGQNNFLAGQGGSDLMANSSDLYNGNIARMVTTIAHATTREILPLGNAYRYDQLNRLSESRSFTNLNLSLNTWEYSGNYDKKYWNLFRYDANGNILRQYRHNQVGNLIDGMDYLYKTDLQGRPIQNRLYQVKDVVGSGDFPDDIDDMGSFDPSVDGINVNNNYVYDQEGRLISDRQEDIDKIVWRVDGKVAKIIRPGGIDKKNINFEYDAMGHRIAKHVLTSDNVLEKSTYYVLDAQGNTMSVYERKVNELTESIDFYQAEKHIYGSARLGVMNDSVGLFNAQNANYEMYVINHVIGKRNYELSNHLGNVLSVISDKPIPHDNAGTIDYYMADIREAHDYSPFGVLLNERTSTVLGSEKFRYGFNGMQKDDEIKNVEGSSYDFGARTYDSRLGRFLSIDPRAKDFAFMSPYCYAANSPIRFIDENGEGPGDRVKKAKSFEGSKYSQKPGLNTGIELRTGLSAKALEYIDCSELVCRVLAEDGLTPKIRSMATGELVNFFSNTEKWHKSDIPQEGDIFLWRKNGKGHTGIVTGINDDGTIEITHAKGTKYGTVIDNNVKLTYFTGHKGWQGFFRPVSETEDNEEDKVTELETVTVSAKRTSPKLLTKPIQTIEGGSSNPQEIIENKVKAEPSEQGTEPAP